MRLFILKEALEKNIPAQVRFEYDPEVKQYPQFFVEVTVESPHDVRRIREIEWERFSKDSTKTSPSA